MVIGKVELQVAPEPEKVSCCGLWWICGIGSQQKLVGGCQTNCHVQKRN